MNRRSQVPIPVSTLNQSNNSAIDNNYILSVLFSFIPVGSILFLSILINSLLKSSELGVVWYVLIIGGLFVAANSISLSVFGSMVELGIYWRSALLCNTFLAGFMLTNQTSYLSMVCFGYYIMCLSFFHLSEFVFTALFNQKEVSTDSFLINHSLEYGLAALASWLEFFIELFFVPSMKLSLYTRFVGLFLVLFGELFRKLAMYTAGTNFNHYVQEKRKQDHVLVKSGIYSLVRHPSYFGWFYWSIGTQILLANPVCTILYAVSSWKFFKTRITYEEFHLCKFFGKEYLHYQQKVPSGIPFVEGYIYYGDESLD